jgi:flagellar biosynthesis/type III secretory pathway protein FliH
MSQGTVLKAKLATAVPQSRVVLRAPAQDGETVASEPGVWLSQFELDAMRERCFEQGREQGQLQAWQDARRQAEREAQAQLERELKQRQDKHAKEQAEKWRGLATALASQTQGLRDQLQAEVTEWTFIAIVRLLGQRSPEDVAAAVRQVLEAAQLDGPMTVLLHTQDLAALESSRAASMQAWPAHLRFAADEHVKLGGCLVQSTVQTLDARLEVQLALLRDSLNAARLQCGEGEAES